MQARVERWPLLLAKERERHISLTLDGIRHDLLRGAREGTPGNFSLASESQPDSIEDSSREDWGNGVGRERTHVMGHRYSFGTPPDLLILS